MFRAIKQHVTGTYHGKQRHGIKLLIYAILPCPFEHVLVVSGDSSVFMFCDALPVHHAHVFCFHIVVL